MSTSKHNGLTAWRERLNEQRRLKLDELARLRKHATTEVRDGRKFKVLHIPDRYDERTRIEPMVKKRAPKRKQNAA